MLKFNSNHLQDARMGYLKHFVIAISEAWFLFKVSILSLIHAIFPWIFDFDLLDMRIKRLKKLKKKLPDDEMLKGVSFDDGC